MRGLKRKGYWRILQAIYGYILLYPGITMVELADHAEFSIDEVSYYVGSLVSHNAVVSKGSPGRIYPRILPDVELSILCHNFKFDFTSDKKSLGYK